MPYYPTLDEDLARAKAIVREHSLAVQPSTLTYQLLESFVAEIERLHGAILLGDPSPALVDEDRFVDRAFERIVARLPPALRRRLHRRSVSDAERERLARRVIEDRKSTRLNSSHLGISYAV